ncbi:MAG: YceI family protein [Bacteroidetes bacterium]|nr:YceI family protein [Bacteroidota bacterium]
MNTVKTGNGKRDRDMREDVLETEKWPITYFKGSFIKVEKKDNQNIYSVKILGKMFVHGVEKEIEIPGEIKIVDGVMTVESKFSIYLNDYDIEAPSLLAFIKVAEEIKLKLNFKLKQTMEKEN